MMKLAFTNKLFDKDVEFNLLNRALISVKSLKALCHPEGFGSGHDGKGSNSSHKGDAKKKDGDKKDKKGKKGSH